MQPATPNKSASNLIFLLIEHISGESKEIKMADYLTMYPVEISKIDIGTQTEALGFPNITSFESGAISWVSKVTHWVFPISNQLNQMTISRVSMSTS